MFEPENQLKGYGFVAPKEITGDQFVLGATNQLPKIVLREDGEWGEFLPQYEPQFNERFDSYGCTVWGTENVVETMLKQQLGADFNFSERFIYNLARVRPPGADPHVIAETIRANGLVNDSLLPMTPSYDEFLKPEPMTKELLDEGKRWPYELRHEWLWREPQTRENRTTKIMECLRYSPLGVSVTAWIEEDGVYVDRGQPNTHWCMVYGKARNGWKVFDSYDQSLKILSFDHNIAFCKRYWLVARPVSIKKKFWLWELLRRLWQ